MKFLWGILFLYVITVSSLAFAYDLEKIDLLFEAKKVQIASPDWRLASEYFKWKFFEKNTELSFKERTDRFHLQLSALHKLFKDPRFILGVDEVERILDMSLSKSLIAPLSYETLSKLVGEHSPVCNNIFGYE